jgi:uncharacterized protein (DUF952 family)
MILHVCTTAEWAACHNDPDYAPDAFKREHFIHCCQALQLEGVLQRYFKDQQDLLLLTIDEYIIDSEVRYESGTDGGQFPHVYGRINKNAIVKLEQLRPKN